MQAGKLFKLKLRMQVECRGKDDLAVMAFLSCVIEWGFGASFFCPCSDGGEGVVEIMSNYFVS